MRTTASRFCLAIAGLGLSAGAAQALPVPSAAPDAGPGVTLVYGGCGPYGHRTPYGDCAPGGQAGAPLPGGYMVRCPPGYHLGPQGRACWPNRRRFYY